MKTQPKKTGQRRKAVAVKPAHPLMLNRKCYDKQKVMDVLCQRIATNSTMSLRAAMEDYIVDGVHFRMPNVMMVMEWMLHDEDVAKRYTQAKESQAELLASEIVSIADDASGDLEYDKDGKPRQNVEFARRSHLRVEARKWIAAKLLPKKYGDRVFQEITGANGGAIEHNVTYTPDQAYQRLVKGEVIEGELVQDASKALAQE